jgi:hypothetical protein
MRVLIAFLVMFIAVIGGAYVALLVQGVDQLSTLTVAMLGGGIGAFIAYLIILSGKL